METVLISGLVSLVVGIIAFWAGTIVESRNTREYLKDWGLGWDDCLDNLTNFSNVTEEELKNSHWVYWANICKLQEKQRRKGLKAYGVTLEENNSLSVDERLTYLEEELVDALMYLEHLKSSHIKESGV